MKNAFRYAMRVWLTAVVITPVIYNLIMFGNTAGILGALLFSIIMMVWGEIYSLPSWLILGCITWGLNDFAFRVMYKKLIINAISIFLVWLPFWCVDFFGEEGQGLFGKNGVYILCVTYWIIITFGIWFYKLDPTFTKPNSDQLDQI